MPRALREHWMPQYHKQSPKEELKILSIYIVTLPLWKCRRK